MVLTGAEGVVENGGVINKLGTYTLALVAAAHGTPFYVAAESYKVSIQAIVVCKISCAKHISHNATCMRALLGSTCHVASIAKILCTAFTCCCVAAQRQLDQALGVTVCPALSTCFHLCIPVQCSCLLIILTVGISVGDCPATLIGNSSVMQC